MSTTQSSMLEMMLRPAFYVSDGKITQVNQAASPYLLREGTEIFPLLATGAEEYASFREGCMYLSLSIAGQNVGASVVSMENCHLFVLDKDAGPSALRALALAAQELRTPLSGMFLAAEMLLPSASADPKALSMFNRRSHQLMRIISNMSDAADFCQPEGIRMDYVQLCDFLEELLSKTAWQLEEADIHLHYTLPAKPVYTMADTDKLERAILNLISNAAKRTPAGGRITVNVSQRNRLYLSVTDQGNTAHIPSDIFSRYLREPSLDNGMEGLGLGMVLVRAAATAHNGAVLIDHPDEKSTRVTMSMELQRNHVPPIHSPLLRIDYAGERDHGLLELSEVLPASLYEEM